MLDISQYTDTMGPVLRHMLPYENMCKQGPFYS